VAAPFKPVRSRGFAPKEGHKGMQCPHCWSEINVAPHAFALGEDQDGSWQVSEARCPACSRLIVNLHNKEGRTYPVWPASLVRPRLSDDVPAHYATEYHVAAQILSYSPEASAAVARRLLHRFLAEQVQAGSGGLAEQIRQTEGSPELPLYLEEALRTFSRVAKLEFGSGKSERPEALTPVEPGEAEWLLDILQPLFELYFVQPARLRRKQSALEEKIGPLWASEPSDPSAPSDTAADTEHPEEGSGD
jgi:hypothetical protein